MAWDDLDKMPTYEQLARLCNKLERTLRQVKARGTRVVLGEGAIDVDLGGRLHLFNRRMGAGSCIRYAKASRAAGKRVRVVLEIIP